MTLHSQPPTKRSQRLRARWVFPVDGEPIEDGVIAVESGRIVGLNTGPDAEAVDLGHAAVIPGLVNAHTHLEFSDLTEPLSIPRPFTAWIQSLVTQRRDRATDTRAAIVEGLHESAAAGCTLVGEIATDDVSATMPTGNTPRAVVFRELLGIGDDVIADRLATAERHLSEVESLNNRHVIAGLSPHAPYSVSAELFMKLVDLAVEADAPVAMHLAETREELKLLRSGTGPFVDMLKEFGVWRDRFWIPGDSVRGYLEQLSRARRALVIHGNYLNSDDIEFLTQHPQMTIVYCPRTHGYFGHPDHPWRTLLEQGVSMALGTDSRASNPDLSLWNEVLFLHETFGDVPADTLLRLATLGGAAALGQSDETGTLTPGKSADLAVVSLCDEAQSLAKRRPTDALLRPGNRVTATMRSGHWIAPQARGWQGDRID